MITPLQGPSAVWDLRNKGDAEVRASQIGQILSQNIKKIAKVFIKKTLKIHKLRNFVHFGRLSLNISRYLWSLVIR